MFDIGMTELLLIGIVALIVVGPKDLPGLFRTLGRFTARARALGREFTRAMNEAADESGMKDVASDLRKAADPRSMGLDALKDAADKFDKWDPAAHPAAEHGRKVLEQSQRSARAKADERTAQAELDKEPAQAQSMPEMTPKAKPKPKAERKAGAKPGPKAGDSPETAAKAEARGKSDP